MCSARLVIKRCHSPVSTVSVPPSYPHPPNPSSFFPFIFPIYSLLISLGVSCATVSCNAVCAWLLILCFGLCMCACVSVNITCISLNVIVDVVQAWSVSWATSSFPSSSPSLVPLPSLWGSGKWPQLLPQQMWSDTSKLGSANWAVWGPA